MPFFLDYLWKIIKSWETVISLFVGLFFLLIEVFSPYEIPIELYYVVFILTFLYASYSEYASLAGKVMPEMLDIKPRLKVHHFNGSRFSYKLVDTTFQTEDYQPVKADQPNADGKYPIVDLNVTSEKHNRLIPNAELKVFFQVENIGKTKAIILKMWGELSSITPFELGGAGVLFEDESYIDYPIPLNPYDERLSLVCNGKAIHQRHLSDEQFISRLKTLKKKRRQIRTENLCRIRRYQRQ